MGWLSPAKPRRRALSVRYRAPKPVRPAPTCVDCSATIFRTSTRGRAPLRCPACRTQAQTTRKWKLAPGALETVQAHFGLERPLYVRRSAGRQQQGSYRGIHLGFAVSKKLEPYAEYHVIQLSSALDAKQAARTLLHEACHAQQREKDMLVHVRASRQIRAHGDPYRSVAAHRAYRDHPTEVEARAAEEAVSHLGTLVLEG
jgi:hypothetical protein